MRKNPFEDKINAIEQARKQVIEELSLRRREAPFLVWFSTIIGFYAARAFVVFFPEVNLMILEYHIHHFYYGIILILLGGALALTFKGAKLARASCVLYGLGLGMFIDEIGLLLTEGEYWAEITYMIFFTFLATSLVMIFLWDFLKSDYWEEIKESIRNL